ncbi:hypothetical protein HYR53_04205 [Candidatus Acetothermia bacterium]|nr:hypothetical protein [Candidatus Acetothermia bacterium]
MNKKSTPIISFIALLLFSLGIFGCNQASSTSSTSTPNQPNPASSQIGSSVAFECGKESQFALCVVSSDGGDPKTVAKDIVTSKTLGYQWLAFAGPSINKSGIIAYVCNDGDDEICVVKSDGTGAKQLTQNDADDDYPVINNDGWIAYLCEKSRSARESICLIKADGTGFKMLAENAAIEGPISMNSARQIVYVCRDVYEIDTEICLTDSNGKAITRLTNNDQDDDLPKINDAGKIIYNCHSDASVYYLCLVNADGKGYESLSQATISNWDHVLNNNGQIAFISSDAKIVVMRPNDAKRVEIADPNRSICCLSLSNSGLVIYNCTSGICSAQSDGSNIKKLAGPAGQNHSVAP